jgi:ribosomal protein S18 acetylase RimI-like enzyme
MEVTDTGVSLRKARPEDTEAILQLWQLAGATPSVTDTAGDLQRALACSTAFVLLAETASQLVGSVIGGFDGWRGNLYRLAVHPEYRRRGIARALVAEAERRLADQGARRITALVEKAHDEAVAFWEAARYSADDRIARFVRNV